MPTTAILQLGILGVLLPAVVAGISYLLLKRITLHASSVAITLGFLAGFIGISGSSAISLTPKTIQQWLPLIAILSLSLGLLETLWRKNLWALWGVRVVLLGTLLWRLFQPFINHPFERLRWSMLETSLNLLATTTVILIFWIALELLVARQRASGAVASGLDSGGAILVTALVIIGTGSSISVVLSHSLVMGQLTGALVAALGAVMVLMWFMRGSVLAPSVTPVITLLLALPWLSLYSTLPVVVVLLLAVSPYVLLVRFEKRSLLQRSVLNLISVTLPVIVMLIVAWRMG